MWITLLSLLSATISIILTVIAGVTGRAATGPRLWMQLVWGTATVILGLIEVAISNLVDNAIVFSDDGGAVHVSLDDEGRLTVRDQGPGVDQAFMEAVFEPFYRVTPKSEGSGLGLSLVKQIVDNHGGRVLMQSDRRGTVVKLFL